MSGAADRDARSAPPPAGDAVPGERSPGHPRGGAARRTLTALAAAGLLFVGGVALGWWVTGGGSGGGNSPAPGSLDRPAAAADAPASSSASARPASAEGGGDGPPPWARQGERRRPPSGERDAGAGGTAPSADAADRRETAQELRANRRTAIVRAARSVTPSVVSVRVARRTAPSRRGFFDLFFERDRVRQGRGTGFVIDRRGHLLTNEHVVQGADRIEVAAPTGRVYRAEVVGVDELTDVALLKIPGGRVPAANLGTSSDLMVGEPVLAVGNPFGFHLANVEPTVTAGVVSGVGRDIRSRQRRGMLYADMVQTDAAINPGNSGGPLVNVHGEVVGVNSSILSESGGSVGVGFAIPVDRALRIANELRKFGRVRQPWAGVDVASSRTDTLLSRTVVRRVAPNSPAERAGLREGDVLVSVGGNRIDGPMDWEIALLDAGVGSTVGVEYRRGGRLRSTRLTVGEPPSERADRIQVLRGLELVSVTPQIAAERQLGVDRGALIVSIQPEVARATRMREGDVILAVNRREVAGAEDAATLFERISGQVQVWLYRDGASVITSFRVR